MFRFVILILSILLAGAGLASLFRDEKQKKHLKVSSVRLLQNLDESYESFIEKRLNLSLLKEQKIDLDIKILVTEAFTILKPPIDALVALLTNQRKPSFYTQYESYYFRSLPEILMNTAQNIASIRKQALNINQKIENEKKQVYIALKDAISADLQKRFLDLKMRGYFEEGL